MPPTQIEAPTSKREHSRYFSPQEYLTVYWDETPIELITNDQGPNQNCPTAFLPQISVQGTSRIHLFSQSFTVTACQAMTQVLGLSQSGTSIVLPNGPRWVELVYDSGAPAFTRLLNDVPGPTSLAIYCKGLDTFKSSRLELGGRNFQGTATVGAVRLDIVMIFVEGLWIELIERRRVDA